MDGTLNDMPLTTRTCLCVSASSVYVVNVFSNCVVGDLCSFVLTHCSFAIWRTGKKDTLCILTHMCIDFDNDPL